MTADEPGCRPRCLSRRAVLGGGAVCLIAISGCEKYGGSADTSADTPTSGAPLARTTDIPVAGGRIFEAAKVVVTQPTTGAFKGLSAICTHLGCVVSDVKSGTIRCGCHGSQFTLEGDVAQGPATQPLPTRQITVSGGDIFLA